MPPFSCGKARDHHVARAGQTDREGIVAPGPRAHNPAPRRLCGLPGRENPWQQACETEAGEEQRIGGRHRKVAGHACPSIPRHAGHEERRGGTVGRVGSSRGVQQGVACCTHAGPWLESNLYVPLPTGCIATHLLIVFEPIAGTEVRSWQRTTLMIASLQPSTHCSTLSDLTMPL